MAPVNELRFLPSASMVDRLIVGLISHICGHRTSAWIYRLTQLRAPPFLAWSIRCFVALFKVDLSEAAVPDPSGYASFNDFFTRALAPGVRPIAPSPQVVVSPVDGRICAAGAIHDLMLVQAKGHSYTVTSLLAGDAAMADGFAGGTFATIYLSPRDYHRIHMPLTGTLTRTLYVPGALFAVNTRTVRTIQDCLARNERLICLFDTEAGPMAVVLVGAVHVGSMATVWAGQVTPPYGGDPVREIPVPTPPLVLQKGAEMGRFNMGSTVIVLFPRAAVALQEFRTTDPEGFPIRMGTTLGRLRGSA
jgi:phosphatidylserine decarboxylase